MDIIQRATSGCARYKPALTFPVLLSYHELVRKRSAAVILGIGFLTLISSAACKSEPAPPDYVQVCEDDQEVRVVDEDCNADSSGHIIIPGRHWAYYPSNASAPAVGKVGTGRVTPPAGASVGRIPTSGGFGTHSGTVVS